MKTMEEEGQVFMSRKGVGFLGIGRITARGVSRVADAIQPSGKSRHLLYLIEFTGFVVLDIRRLL